MSLIQYTARFENLRNAYDDTMAEIAAHIYPGKSFYSHSFPTLQCFVANILPYSSCTWPSMYPENCLPCFQYQDETPSATSGPSKDSCMAYSPTCQRPPCTLWLRLTILSRTTSGSVPSLDWGNASNDGSTIISKVTACHFYRICFTWPFSYPIVSWLFCNVCAVILLPCE
jgi:hypothetical protein